MDIFKLFFDHDLRLDSTGNGEDESQDRLEAFMSPSPTFSKFYLAGTCLEQEKIGLDCLGKYSKIIEKLDDIFSDYSVWSPQSTSDTISNAVEDIEAGEPMLLAKAGENIDQSALRQLPSGQKHGAADFRDQLREALMTEHIIIYKVQAQDGFDLHIFSKENIYDQFFYPFRELSDKNFRFFSINSKRMSSKRHYYFEVHRLDRPPHGAEEVFQNTEF